jgi:hypothetical protein
MSKENRRGRPPLEPAESRSERLVTFLTQPEYEFFKVLCEQGNLSLSAYAHKVISTHIAKRKATEMTINPKKIKLQRE